MAAKKLFLLPGDGIGPEAMGEVKKIIAAMNEKWNSDFVTDEGLVGGSAYDAHGQAVSEADMQKALAADAVLFGAVGGPKWDGVPYEVRPEAGLLRLRKDLELFANLRPAICYPALAASSSLKPSTATRRNAWRGLGAMAFRLAAARCSQADCACSCGTRMATAVKSLAKTL